MSAVMPPLRTYLIGYSQGSAIIYWNGGQTIFH